MVRYALFALLFCLGLPAVHAAATPRWDVETVLRQDQAEGWSVSPDGERAVWVKRSLDEPGRRYRWDLYLSDLRAPDGPREPRRLTRHAAGSFSPRWSPDGDRIAFLSARPQGEGAEGDDDDPGKGETGEERQLWLLDLAGGEPEPLTRHPGGVHDYRWLDAGAIVYLAGEAKSLERIAREEAFDKSIVVGDEEHEEARRLFRLDLAAARTRRLSDEPRPVLDFAASPDGRWIVGRVSRDLHFDYDFQQPPRIVLWDLQASAAKDILDPAMVAADFVWDLKSEGFYFTRPVASDSTDLFVSLPLLGYYDLERGGWLPVDLEWGRGIGPDGYRASEKGLLVQLADGTRNRLLHLERKGLQWRPRFLDPPERGCVDMLALGPDGKTLLTSYSTASDPPRFYAAALKSDKLQEEREFLALNAYLRELPLPPSETVRWIGAGGDIVEGMLHYPLDFDPAQPAPLVLMIHGGPSDMDRDRFQESWGGSPALLCARGALVLRPNYHGSGGYGLEWLESIKSRYYELEVPDILAGVDYLVERGYADESRLGIQGWSNGAILAIAACIDSGQRFRALAAGAGDVNWASDYGNCDFGAAFGDAYFGGPPWQQPQLYVDKSPIFRIDELQVPTIIFFGTEDRTVPVEQGWQLYRALQSLREVPVRYLLFPGEDHTLMSPVHRRRQLVEEMRWFDRYLFDSYLPANEALKRDSPLDRALRLADVARNEGFFGEMLDGALLPELVPADGLLVGRFEVTRAQWSVFSGKGLPQDEALLTGNHPMTDISAVDAGNYCRWLSGLTGLDCRLPSVGELAALQAKSLGAENTLAYWVGYELTSDDAERIAPQVEELEANRNLLFPVGSFAPAPASAEGADLFDLGGNAAEWAVDASGTPRPLGLSALSVADVFAEPVPPPPAYVGVRVVAAERNEAKQD